MTTALNSADLTALAKSHSVCIRPVFAEVADNQTRTGRMVATSCGLTLEGGSNRALTRLANCG
jgi:hypothetical protein